MAQIINGITLYTTNETAAKLGVSIPTLCRMRKKNLIVSTQVGHHKLTSEEEINAYLMGLTKERSQKLSMAEKLIDRLK